jgi:hypothetical protein
MISTWAWAAEPGTTWYVYQSTDGTLDGFSTPMAGTPVDDPTFTATTGAGLYQVRACRLMQTGAGTFRNLSQASFITVE